MKWQIFSIGKPSLDYAKLGIEEYGKRLRRYVKLEMRQAKEAGSEKNSRFLLEESAGSHRIALDERGKTLNTRQFARLTDAWRHNGMKSLAFLIGGAEGHTSELRDTADEVWTLSGFTLQHELALLVLVEQIYRVHTLLQGEPYHRD